MTTHGLTPEGFIKKTYDVLFEETRQLYEDRLGKDVDLSPDSDYGQTIAINAEERAKDWDVWELVYYYSYANSAQGISLDNAAQNTGHKRERSTYSFVTLRFTGSEGSPIPLGSKAQTETGIEADTQSSAVIPVAGFVDVPSRATTKGNIVALAGTMTVLPSPISGVTAVTNTTDLSGGRDTESDQDFNLRRLDELQNPGTSSIEGIRNALLELEYMLKAIPVENVNTTPDGEGRPGKSFEAYVSVSLAGGIDDPANTAEKLEVATTIYNAKAAGIQTWGDLSDTVIDSDGFPHDVFFSEPDEVDMIVVAEVVKNTDSNEGPLYPANGDDLIKESLLTYGGTLDLGQDVWFNKVSEAISQVEGVKGINSLTLNGGTINVGIATTEISKWDSSNFTITSA